MQPLLQPTVIPPHVARARTEPYLRLSMSARPQPHGEWLARIVASWLGGDTPLPSYLGLGAEQWRAFMHHHFPEVEPYAPNRIGQPADARRNWERQALVELFQTHASIDPREAAWLARILSEACLGSEHLWRDLGLWSRQDLSNLLHLAFAPLAQANTRDMKWKKFFYRRLCEAEGVRLCTAPSCESCADLEHCFGPET
ncbi:MAG: nitrogen fixation protein NifQ [Magnetococcales bacterium]|nr:nitrogen fixation protein NifQ [Magnetococcales bacterium]